VKELERRAELCTEREQSVKPNKARRSWKAQRMMIEAELQRRFSDGA
jgi:hypothetical protein